MSRLTKKDFEQVLNENAAKAFQFDLTGMDDFFMSWKSQWTGFPRSKQFGTWLRSLKVPLVWGKGNEFNERYKRWVEAHA